MNVIVRGIVFIVGAALAGVTIGGILGFILGAGWAAIRAFIGAL